MRVHEFDNLLDTGREKKEITDQMKIIKNKEAKTLNK
jgi:hypothetical protein